VHLYLQGLLSHLPHKNAEDIATFVDVERLVMQEGYPLKAGHLMTSMT
jgi:hypothetical protein